MSYFDLKFLERAISPQTAYGKHFTGISYGDISIVKYGNKTYIRRFRSGFWYENEPFPTLGLDGIE